MRALCGAIITAGALIGLGLTALGIGTRYQTFPYRDPGSNDPLWVRFRDIDSAMMIVLVVLIAALLIGLALAFIGLAFHHHRRHHEFLREHGHLHGAQPPAHTPT